jgi:CHAT domain-containing protein
MRSPARLLAGLALLVAGCQAPPPAAFVAGGQTASVAAPVGNNAVGEPCNYRQSSAPEGGVAAARQATITCGTWKEPSAVVFDLGSGADAGRLRQLATAGPWRNYIDQRFACEAPVATRVLDGDPAQLLQCRRRSGGWPHLALTAAANGHVYAADGTQPALPAIEATVAVLSGKRAPVSAASVSEAERLIASRPGRHPFGSGDEGRYHELIALGDAYNNVDDWAHAEQAFRDALAVQQRYLSPDNPGLALTLMKLAAEISHRRKDPAADGLLDRAARLAARAQDPLLSAQLHYYRAVTAAYQGNAETALHEAEAAQQAFDRLVPPEASERALRPSVSEIGTNAPVGRIRTANGGAPLVDYDAALSANGGTIDSRAAITGLAESMRLRASLLRGAGNPAEATAFAERADRLLEANGLSVSSTGARALRLVASDEASRGNYGAAGSESSAAGSVFQRVVPGERPAAINALSEGAYQLRQGNTGRALALFRAAGAILQKPTVLTGAPPDLIYPWLDALYAQAQGNPTNRTALDAEMFLAAQLAKSSITAQDIAESAARLAAGDPQVADVLRRLQQRQRELGVLTQQRDRLAASDQPNAADLKNLDTRIATVQKEETEAEAQAQEAAPRYRRLIEQPVTATELQGLLRPDEALLAFFVAEQGSYGFLLERDRLVTYRIPLTRADTVAQIQHLRETVLPKAVDGHMRLPEYDTAGAYRLYAALIGPVADQLQDKRQLILAPRGALLGFPLEALVTEPGVKVSGVDYRKVPFLVRRFALSFVPAPRTFVDLRRIKSGAPGPLPFIGFGDFTPPSDRQIAALFPPDRCGEDNRNLHLLGALPGTKVEVTTIGRLLGARPSDIVLGPAFTKARLAALPLRQYRIVHLATHALLPAELGKCQSEPAILTSVPQGAASADAGFLRPEDIDKLTLDADLVVLSACDTAGPDEGGGESLSGLARAFFTAGTRGVLVTHWSTLDLAAMRLMTATLGGGKESTATALRNAQLQMIDGAGSDKQNPMLMSHPYAWAPFVLIGDGVYPGNRGPES